MIATWQAPLEKIVIARWLQKIAEDLGEPSHYIPNRARFSQALAATLLQRTARKRASPMMFDDRILWKGSADGIEALSRVKQRHPKLTAEIFGCTRAACYSAWLG